VEVGTAVIPNGRDYGAAIDAASGLSELQALRSGSSRGHRGLRPGGNAELGRRNKKLSRNNGIGRHDDGVVRFKILLLTISGEYVKYDYHIMQGD
jgi:hypothetical protein